MSNSNLIEYKLRAVFPIKQYLEKHFPDGYMTTTGQYNATCCHCGKKNKFYYDVKLFKGLCQSCYAKTDGAGFKTIAGLIMFVENLEYEQALERLKSSASIDNTESFILGEINKFKNEYIKSDCNLSIVDLLDMPIQVPIPMKKEPDLDSIAKYFASRKRPMNINILKMFPAYMSDAIFLKNRMIFKIETNDSYAWLGYLMGKADNNNPKTLNPKGSVLSYMLSGYNYFKDSNKPLLTHEGIFDKFRSILRGYNAVCTFGKTLSPRQIALLNATKASEIVFAYDGDTAGLKAMWKAIKNWSKYIDKPLSMMVYPYGQDPDECTAQQAADAFDDRRKLKYV